MIKSLRDIFRIPMILAQVSNLDIRYPEGIITEMFFQQNLFSDCMIKILRDIFRILMILAPLSNFRHQIPSRYHYKDFSAKFVFQLNN